MARALNFSFEDQKFNFEIQKIDRSKLYGYTSIDVKDENGLSCNLANISDDGLHILSKGCVGYTTLTQENNNIATNQLKITDLDGNNLDKIPSSFDTDIALEASSVDELLTLNIKSVYQLNDASEDGDYSSTIVDLLKTHKVLKFFFNYRADYSQDTAFIVYNNEGIFFLVGYISPFEFVGLEQQAVEVEDIDEEEEDFDFGML